MRDIQCCIQTRKCLKMTIFWGAMLQNKMRSFREQSTKTFSLPLLRQKNIAAQHFLISEVWWGVKDFDIVCSISCLVFPSPVEVALTRNPAIQKNKSLVKIRILPTKSRQLQIVPNSKAVLRCKLFPFQNNGLFSPDLILLRETLAVQIMHHHSLPLDIYAKQLNFAVLSSMLVSWTFKRAIKFGNSRLEKGF